MIEFDEIVDHLVVGSSPFSVMDLERLDLQLGITAIVNMQTDADLSQRRIDVGKLEQECDSRDIYYQRCPVREFDDDDLIRRLTMVAREVESLVEGDNRVYLHCNAGKERSPTTAIAWLATYRDYTLDEAMTLVCDKRVCMPRERVLRLVLGR